MKRKVLIFRLTIGFIFCSLVAILLFKYSTKPPESNFKTIRNEDDWVTYQLDLPSENKDLQKSLYFKLPADYLLNEDYCGDNNSNCLYSAIIQAESNEWAPKGAVFISNSYDNFGISGSTSSINYSEDLKTWVHESATESGPKVDELTKWGVTTGNRDVYVGSIGGSHGGSSHYIIEDIWEEFVIVFSFRDSERIRCEYESYECYEWFEDKGSKDGWLDYTYMKELFKEKDDILESIILSF